LGKEKGTAYFLLAAEKQFTLYLFSASSSS
jgi:hypothetical protein